MNGRSLSAACSIEWQPPAWAADDFTADAIVGWIHTDALGRLQLVPSPRAKRIDLVRLSNLSRAMEDARRKARRRRFPAWDDGALALDDLFEDVL